MGWEPAEITSYFYDGDRLVRSVTVREPEFRESDLKILSGLQADDDLPRTVYGSLVSDVLSRDADPANRDAKYRFVADLPHVDFEAKAVAEAQDKFREQWPDADMSFLRWRVQRKEL